MTLESHAPARKLHWHYLDVNVSDEVVAKVVADIHLGNFSEFAQLLVYLLEEVLELMKKLETKGSRQKKTIP